MRKREVCGSADSGNAGKRRTNVLGTCGTKVRRIRDSPESDEKGITGSGELGTFGTKSFDGPEKNGLR
ncbi:hypothetical protein KI387_026288, partial [Taxus chinensis]